MLISLPNNHCLTTLLSTLIKLTKKHIGRVRTHNLLSRRQTWPLRQSIHLFLQFNRKCKEPKIQQLSRSTEIRIRNFSFRRNRCNRCCRELFLTAPKSAINSIQPQNSCSTFRHSFKKYLKICFIGGDKYSAEKKRRVQTWKEIVS